MVARLKVRTGLDKVKVRMVWVKDKTKVETIRRQGTALLHMLAVALKVVTSTPTWTSVLASRMGTQRVNALLPTAKAPRSL
jgi:hypothetical protein